LVDAFLAARRGVVVTTAPVIPSHLEAVTWAFSCGCGRRWTAIASATLTDCQITPPRRECRGRRDLPTTDPRYDAEDYGCGRWSAGFRGV